MKEEAKEFEHQYSSSVGRGKEGPICGGSPGLYDFGIDDEQGTRLEVEHGKERCIYVINICEQENRSSMFITSDKEKLRAFRDAITKILDNT